jgi:hypothetical protein
VNDRATGTEDEILFGWDETPGIVSVWADHEGTALVWRRVEGTTVLERDRFEPWILAASLEDLQHLGSDLAEAGDDVRALVRWRGLAGPAGSFRYLLTCKSGRDLSRAILTGAWARRPGDPRPLPAITASAPSSST